MKTIPFSDILAEVCQLVGLDRITLTDKSFYTVRDFVNKRLGTIWDREEWPETELWMRLFPGNPVKQLTLVYNTFLTESGSEILTENDIPIDLAENEMNAVLDLDTNYPRIYLEEFSKEQFQKGTIGSGYLSVQNPFYIFADDGSRVSSDAEKYNFTYTTAFDYKGEYISQATISVVHGSGTTWSAYGGPNDLSTVSVVFDDNLQLISQLSDTSKGLYGSQAEVLEAWSGDRRKSTKVSIAPFYVEDFLEWYNAVNTDVPQYNEATFVRFKDAGEKWVRCRLRCPRLYGSKWNNNYQYTFGAQVYYDTEQASGEYNPPTTYKMVRGNFWNAGSTSTGTLPSISEAPANVSSNWALVGIPARFKDYLVSGASADFLRSESRMEEATQYEQLAEVAVEQQIDVLIRQQGQIQRMNMVFTY